MIRIPPKDWEALSAYLDNELNKRQRTQLEERLKASSELRSALKELRRTQVVLQSQPRMRAPRNFTLTPAMAGIYSRTRGVPTAFSALRMASLLATFFFVVVFAGDLIAGNMRPMQVARDVQPAMAFGIGGGGGGGAEGPGISRPPVEPTVVVEAAAVEKEAEKAVQSEPEITSEAVGTPAPPAAMVMTATPEGALVPELAQSLNAQPATPDASVGAQAASVEQATPAEPAEQVLHQTKPGEADGEDHPWSLLRILEIVLAFLALGAGVAALYLRRTAIR